MKKFTFTLGITAAVSVAAQTQIIAHRGYWQTTPPTTENSLASLKNAQQLGVYGSEFDIRMTLDKQLVINHDEHHAGMAIAETDFRTLRGARLSNGETLPTLKSYLKLGRKNPGVKLILELKPAKSKALEDEAVARTLALIKQMGLGSQCEFISFSRNICEEIERLQPECITYYLNGDLSPAEIKALKIDGIDYHYKIFTGKHPEWLAQAHALGLKTNAWTVNDAASFLWLKEQGIGFVTTNTPEIFKNLIQ